MNKIDRAKIVKGEGYKSESEYFRNTNPFVNSDHLTKKKVAKKMAKKSRHGDNCCGDHSMHNGLGCCSNGK